MRDKYAEAILFGLGGIILLIFSVLLVVSKTNTRTFICDYEVETEAGVTEESDIYLEWEFGKLTTAKAKLSIHTDEHTTDEQREYFKNKINSQDYYSTVEWQDFWSYQVVADVEYDLNKTTESLGGTTYDEIKSYLETASAGTCKE